jgi:DNA-binding SARP family transcriptional activator
MVRASVVASDRTSAGLLQVRLLGDLELRREGALLPLPASKRTRALLGFLIATASPQSRSTLCDLLWDGPNDPRASLRWSLTKLRAVVDEAGLQRLVADRERVSFDVSRCSIDTAQVQAILATGSATASLAGLEQAAGLLQGEFLDGLDLQTCYRFHHWCMAERERLGALRRGVLQALVERLSHEPERALPFGRAMVAADPLAETVHAALVKLLCAADRYPDAEEHYTWARQLLQREVEIPPGGPLDSAIHFARRERRKPTGAAVAAPPSRAPPAPTESALQATNTDLPALLGRKTECSVIARVIQGDGYARLLFFTGEPGIGKTRMLDYFAESAAAAGRLVVRGRCFEAERVRPYGLWLDALRGVSTAGVADDTLGQAAPLLAGRALEGGNRERLFDSAAALVRALAGKQPLALVFDDLQWIDEASAALLHFVTRMLSDAASILFAGAARAGEVDDNPWAKGLVQSLARERGVQALALAPLGEADARALLGEPSIDASDALRQSGGNPLYLLELARATRRGADAAGRTIDGLIEGRLLALDDSDRELLVWAAAMGGELRPELLAVAAGLPVTEVLAKLARFERRGLIVPAAPGSFDFAHDLMRQAVYRALSQPRRRAIHRQIARALASASADDPWLHGEIVRHAGLAGDALGAARACLAAGEHCLQVYANVQAAEVADRGLAHVEEIEPGAQRVSLEVGLLRLRVSAAAQPSGRKLPGLEKRIEFSIEAAEALGLHAQAAAGWEILAYWRQQASDSDRAREATLAAANLTRGADRTTRCRQLANSGRCLLDIEADPGRGRALLDEAAALASELDLQIMELDWGRALIARAEGDLVSASEALTSAAAQAALAGNHWREFECKAWLATVEFERGRDTEVLRIVNQIVAAAARMGETNAPFAEALGALSRWRQGDGAAEGELAMSIEALRQLDDKAHLAYVLNEAAALLLNAGRHEAAAAGASEALGAAQAVHRPTEIAVARARLACATPDSPASVEWLAHRLVAVSASARATAAQENAERILSTRTVTLPP